MTTNEFIDIINCYVPLDKNDPQTDENYLYELTNKIKDNENGINAIEPILRLIEKYPRQDFGSPGPLVHYIERFIGKYEQKLLDSLERKPTELTLWMLNRVINSEKNNETRINLISKLENISKNINLENEIRDLAYDYLNYQCQK